jgi:uncharacterized protein YjiS (DUF1127 family)
MEMKMNPYTLFPLNAQRASAITGPIGAVANFAGAIAGAITKWYKRNKAIRELSALSDHQLKDIGISRGEIRADVDAMLTAPEPRRAARPRLVAAHSSVPSAHPAPANDKHAELVA